MLLLGIVFLNAAEFSGDWSRLLHVSLMHPILRLSGIL